MDRGVTGRLAAGGVAGGCYGECDEHVMGPFTRSGQPGEFSVCPDQSFTRFRHRGARIWGGTRHITHYPAVTASLAARIANLGK
ncbi:hypothetical protein GCM10009825_03170 [Arthrobacter humicola]|uniref:Uncharacterized protein n=1 Tax=Arthrobacter humicola TaxID=409291 RepID=A0ABP5K7F2_9MICC